MFRKLVSTFLVICITGMSLITPGTATAGTSIWIASASGVSSSWAAWAANAGNWISMPNSMGYGTAVKFPRDNYTQIGQMTWARDTSNPNQAAFNWKMIEGQRWITTGREELGMAGVPSDQISARIDAFPKTASMVFAAYSPDTAEAIIEIQKIEKTPTGQLVVYRADYTPWHGEFQKWRRDYLTPAERATPSQLGYNPFESFKGATVTDPVFHNISWEGVGVAVGIAMRYSEAHIGWVAADKTRFTQHTKKSGGLFKKTVTTYIDGWAKPQWFVATPIEMQPDGGISAICVKNVGTANAKGTTATCDATEHVATSGVAMSEWNGGNMPNTEENVYSYVNKKSSFTVLAFTILTFAVTWGLASFANLAIGAGAVSGGGISGLSAGLIGAGVYAGVAALGGAGLTTAQAGWAGSTGNGVLTPDYGSMDQHQQRLVQGVRNKQIYSRIGTGLQGVQTLYHGNCPEGYSTAQCKAAGLDPGTLHRPDSYNETNTVLDMRQREVDCKSTGLTGAALAQCAAPKAGVWTTTTGQ